MAAQFTSLTANATLIEEELKEKLGKTDREGQIYRGFKVIVESNAEEIKKRFPKVMRRVGGYNFDEFIGIQKELLGILAKNHLYTLPIKQICRMEIMPLIRNLSFLKNM